LDLKQVGLNETVWQRVGHQDDKNVAGSRVAGENED
jgi:hypothetical protein